MSARHLLAQGIFMASPASANEEIQHMVLNEWNRPGGGPLLISKLGMQLSQDSKATVSGAGVGLKRYIDEHLSDTIRFVPMRGHGGGVAPLAEVAGLTDQQIEERYSSRAESVGIHNALPIYWGDVWRGFQTPMQDEIVRYVLLDAHGRPEVGDSPKDAPLPANAKLIDRNDLVLPDQNGALPPRVSVHQAIENWCRREGVPVASLLYTRPTIKNSSSGDSVFYSKSASIHRRERSSALPLGLNLLTREELARISIPADLVLTILERAGHQ